MPLAYRFGLGAYHLGVRTAATFGNIRARQWVAGRQQDVRPQIEALHAAGRSIAWFHAASLGEFEQGRPVLELLRTERPELAVVLTFFSPSGYERCADTALAEVVTYLPEDTPAEAADWIQLLRPTLAVFIKYEFWYYHLRALRQAAVPTVLIAGSFSSLAAFLPVVRGAVARDAAGVHRVHGADPVRRGPPCRARSPQRERYRRPPVSTVPTPSRRPPFRMSDWQPLYGTVHRCCLRARSGRRT